jgi:hypothetical protein
MRKPGAEMIAEERARQFHPEGWDPAHDDGHKDGSLAIVAACYAVAGREDVRVEAYRDFPVNCGCREAHCEHMLCVETRWADAFPWEPEADKRAKHPAIRRLVIAGALIAAEIDRLQRIDCRRCSGAGTMTSEVAPSGEVTCWDCRGSGKEVPHAE